MKLKFIISVAFLAFLVFPALGMIKRTTVAPKIIVPASYSQLSRSYFSPSVSSSSIASTVSTGSSEKTDQSDQGSNKKIKWYYLPLWGLLGPVGWIALDNMKYQYDKYLKYREYAEFLEISDDAAKVDPELYEVFLKIKKDYGITDNVKFRIIRQLDQLNERQQAILPGACSMFYVPDYNTVFILGDYKNEPKSYLIFSIAHELEHHRQNKRMKGSYFDIDQDIKKNVRSFSIKTEIGADAAAADYQYCSECLGETATHKTPYAPQEMDFGYITTPKGYLSAQDLKLWEDRAKQACALCPAHKAGTHKNRNTPLKEFLPSKVEK